MKKHLITAILVAAGLLSSCSKCIICQVSDGESLLYESEFCASGLDASKKLKEFEEEQKEGNANVKCQPK
jgi:hypothetical protein